MDESQVTSGGAGGRLLAILLGAARPHVFGYFRTVPEQSILCLANFSDLPQVVPAPRLRQLGLTRVMVDIVSGQTVIAARRLELEPLQFTVLLRQGGEG